MGERPRYTNVWCIIAGLTARVWRHAVHESSNGCVAIVYEVVFVAEDEGFHYGSGRYSVALVGGPDGDFAEGLRAVAIDRAVEWARRQSDVVIVFYGDGRRYSAGRRDPASAEMPRWLSASEVAAQSRTPERVAG